MKYSTMRKISNIYRAIVNSILDKNPNTIYINMKRLNENINFE